MPKATKGAQCGQSNIENNLLPEETSDHEESSSEQKIDSEVTFNQPHIFPSMFIPYIEGPKMDWPMNDSLYSRFLKS